MTAFKYLLIAEGQVSMTYNGGGGKSGGTTVVEAEDPPDMYTNTSASTISNLLGGAAENFDEKDAVESSTKVSKKKLGTRGLQIPLAKGSTAPTGTPTPASIGVNV